jgi:hypothetical protein
VRKVAPIPLVVRCSCGGVHTAHAGDIVTCDCGETYDTHEVPQEKLAAAAGARNRQKAYVRFGIAVVALTMIAGFFIAGWWGAALALPLSCLVWWKRVLPHFHSKSLLDVAAIPTTTVEGQRELQPATSTLPDSIRAS